MMPLRAHVPSQTVSTQYPDDVGQSDDPIVIGNPLMLSPDFPPLHTVHATFTAHGAPSNSAVQGF